VAWNRHLAAAGWTCLGWLREHGGHGATLAQQVIFYEEYARSGAPCAALDVAGHGIRVNAVAPSLAAHPFLAKVTSEEVLAELASKEAFGRAAAPWEVASVIVFLVSDYASYLTGEVISVSSQHP
jgi:alkylation response protein AidB-like acyl-CoA dehydrogenase